MQVEHETQALRRQLPTAHATGGESAGTTRAPPDLQQLAKEAASMASDDVLTSELSLLSTSDGEVTANTLKDTLFMLQREAGALATPRDAWSCKVSAALPASLGIRLLTLLR